MTTTVGPSVVLASEHAARVAAAVSGFIKGKAETIEAALVCLLAGGHLLLDDVPGVGKTSLARALASALGVDWQRIQLTPDVLPSDLTGVTVYRQGTGEFVFHPGPLFASIVLADEINRATPRTQSAMLEAMAERTVTVDGVTHRLPEPFMVIATQNPVEFAGTFPLPEAQLDRFLMRVSMGYPDRTAEVDIVTAHHHGADVADVTPVVGMQGLADTLAAAGRVIVDPGIIDYIVRITEATRIAPGVTLGASPRGSIALLRAARARALVHGRVYALPGDVQALAQCVLAHRIGLTADAVARGLTQEAVVRGVLESVPAPEAG